MKKAKTTLKKTNQQQQNKLNSNKAKSLFGRVEMVGRVKNLAKGLVKAMAPKSAKKPQVKIALKAASKATKVHVPKGKSEKAVLPPKLQVSKAPTLKELVKAPVPISSPIMAAKGAVITKGKGEVKGKTSKLSGALLADHLSKMCRETGCENLSTTKGYCRLDYIKNWKKIKRKEMILKEGKLNQYIEELVNKYPEKYIDVIRQDLSTEVNFNKVIHDLELDESIDDLDYDGDSIDALIGGIKKESEGFGDDEF